MIKKERKLSKADFKILKKPDQLIRSDILSAKIFKTAAPSRFSFHISKKIAKSAVARNRAKRMGFLAIQSYLGKIKDGVNIQFSFLSLPKEAAETKSNIANIIKNIK